ncbi:hypothetical protein ABZV91_00020 [Nocardia sp. NPDC004568]|uniref:hypothetical protein n=1 Tax=Nocardia sp. NPDC004568 TaxID=3154551 RepID=UPI0033BA40D3
MIMFAATVGCVVCAVLLLFGDTEDDDIPRGLAQVFGVVAIALAVICAAIAVLVWSGREEGRNAATGAAALICANGVVAMLDSEPGSIGVGVAALILAAAIAGPLWTPSARAYYS